MLAKKAWLVPAAATLAEKANVQFALKNATGAVKFETSNPAIISVDANGVVTAVAKGTASIKATDSKGTVQSLDINVGAVASKPPGGGNPPGQPPTEPPGGSECPLGDPQLCQIICQIMPTAPWCQ